MSFLSAHRHSLQEIPERCPINCLGCGLVVRWCWVNFQYRGVLCLWISVKQGPTVLAVGAYGGCMDIFSLVYHFSFLSPSLGETARYRLKYSLKGPLSPKHPTNTYVSHLLVAGKTNKTELYIRGVFDDN